MQRRRRRTRVAGTGRKPRPKLTGKLLRDLADVLKGGIKEYPRIRGNYMVKRKGRGIAIYRVERIV